MSKPLWILDRYLLERSRPESGVSFAEALVSVGCDVSLHSFSPQTRSVEGEFPELTNRPVVAYGSFPFVKRVLASREQGVLRPGSFARIENLAYSVFSAYMGNLLLNSDFTILPFGELARRGSNGRNVFIRPNKVTKSFTGFKVTPEEFDREVRLLSTLSRVSPEELVVVASAKEIELECRYVICDGRVVAGSTYGWEDCHVPTAKTDPRCDRVAEQVAALEWQADTAYTCDVAVSCGVARVVELNSFSCAGLYACDTVAVAKAVTSCAVEEYGFG